MRLFSLRSKQAGETLGCSRWVLRRLLHSNRYKVDQETLHRYDSNTASLPFLGLLRFRQPCRSENYIGWMRVPGARFAVRVRCAKSLKTGGVIPLIPFRRSRLLRQLLMYKGHVGSGWVGGWVRRREGGVGTLHTTSQHLSSCYNCTSKA